MSMRVRLCALVLLAGLVAAGMAAAQSRSEITVDELVSRALAEHPDLRAARAELEAAAARVRQAALRPNPMLDLGGQKAVSPDNNLSVGVTVPLDLNGRKEGRVGIAERELAMKRAQLADRERRLRADVRSKAGDLFAAQRDLAVTDELLQINRDAVALVVERVRSGASPELDENLLRVEVNRLEASRHVLASRVEIAGLQIVTAVGVAPDAPVALRGDLASPPSTPVEAMLGAAASERADVRTARADVAMAEARIRKEQAEGRWDASINVGYQRQEFGFDLRGLTDRGTTRPIQDTFHYFGGGVTITLPVRNRNEGAIAAAAADAVAAERRRELAELVARQEVQAAGAQHAAARRALDVYERGVRDLARANLDVVRQSYRLGRGTLLDVVAEQRRYIEVEHGYTEALRRVWDAAVELERAIGGPAR
jgi:cobalt-zinc-cadmium efflux system outer membrane protein